jgi:hypothetical protein
MLLMRTTPAQIMSHLMGQLAPGSRINAPCMMKDQAFLSGLNRAQIAASEK